MVKLKVGDQIIDFMVDTGAEMSVVTKPVAPLSEKANAIEEVTGEKLIRPFCLPWKCQMGGHQVTHEFLNAQYLCWEIGRGTRLNSSHTLASRMPSSA